MELFILFFFVVIAGAAALGWVADSRDGADWTPTDAGRRVPPGCAPPGCVESR